MSPAPTIRHQEISQRISQQLGNLLNDCKQCRALLPVDWKIDDDIVVQPDNSIVCGSIENSFLDVSPSVIFEVLSPLTEKKDKTTKFHLYEKNKVTYYCIINPDSEVAKIYELRNNKYHLVSEGTDLEVTFELDECEILFSFISIWS